MKPIRLGRMTIHKIHEMDSATPLLAQLPGTTAADLARLKEWYTPPDNELTNDPATSSMTFGMHSWVIEIDERTILVDSCCGNHKQRSLEAVHMLDTRYLENLHSAGFAPEDIDCVMCTHLHFDHVGWNTRLENGKWVPTFPNAEYLFTRRDFEYFVANPQGEELHHEAFCDSVVPVMDSGQGTVVEEDHIAHREIGNGIWLEHAPGHSPGCCTVHGRADGPEAIFWGDVIHHPLQMLRFDLPFAFDADPVQASKTRQSVMRRAAEAELACFPAHFRLTSAGKIIPDGDVYRYEWVPE